MAYRGKVSTVSTLLIINNLSVYIIVNARNRRWLRHGLGIVIVDFLKPLPDVAV